MKYQNVEILGGRFIIHFYDDGTVVMIDLTTYENFFLTEEDENRIKNILKHAKKERPKNVNYTPYKRKGDAKK